MNEANTLIKEAKPAIEIGEVPPSMNGNGLAQDIKLFCQIVKRFRWWFTGLFILVTAISFWCFNYFATYTATAKFAITDWSQAYTPTNYSSIYTPDRVNQMLALFLSDSVVQFLIKKYDMTSQLEHPDNILEQEELQSDI